MTWAGLVGDKLGEQFRRFIALCDRRGCAFTLDGEPLRPEIPRFRALRPLGDPGGEWAHLGVHHFEEHLLVVAAGRAGRQFDVGERPRRLPRHGRLLGLYRGAPLARRGWRPDGMFPARVSIFRGPITRLAAGDTDRLRREVKHVVLHELAHYFRME